MGAKRKRRDWFWVTRYSSDVRPYEWVSVWPGASKPKELEYQGDIHGNPDAPQTVCYPHFRRITGVSLRPGDCKQVRIRCEVIDE